MNDLLLFADSSNAVENLSIFDPVSPPGESIVRLSLLVAGISAFIFLIVEGVLFYSVVRFRARGPRISEPPQVYGSKAIEIAWTSAPALIVFILVLVVTRTLWDVNRPNPVSKPQDHALFVTVVGHQWWWEYIYESYDGRKLNVIGANEMHMPASTSGIARPVYLTLKSADVCHSFWVPRLGGKTDLIPGHPNEMWFQTDKPGLYLGQCAEYCGTQHANMLLRVTVDEPAEFERWLEHEAKSAAVPASPAAKQGQATFLAQSCVNCHRVRGTPAGGTFGPDLTHLAGRDTLASGMIENDRDNENLRMWLANPQEVKLGCLMPAFGLSDREIDEIVAYLSTLR